MGHHQFKSVDVLTVEDAAARLEVDGLTHVARAAFDHAGELVAPRVGRRPTVLGAVRLASRRSRCRTLERERFSSVFDVDADLVVAAHADLASHLTPPADEDDVRSLRRRLVVVHELVAAAERDRLDALQLPQTYLADDAPWLLGRTQRRAEASSPRSEATLDVAALQSHTRRLEADLELARLGTTLYALVHGEA
ncbi:hypothetical protein D8Y22_10840 [Salinadaptatus halalkaliphilus]|uniref:Uncharacterized protein n=1 Tax=Salinadaptatus halalkaliphilus TaxID=2419781 RepID=A0A4S3TL32_9EURY|nr:hypothetical protein [Salinadaptatus halalkaliphilus]THE64859.1 hypothetical protein D8Y22_10840 [Salinadaptatus halalkaliphilus]